MMLNKIARFIQQHKLATCIMAGILGVTIFAAGVFTEHLATLTARAGTLLVGFVLAFLMFVFFFLGATITFTVLAIIRKESYYRELAARFLLPMIFAAVGLVLGLAKSPQGMAAYWAILITTVSAICGWAVDDILRWVNQERQLKKDIEWIRAHIEKLSVYYAFHTDNDRLENLLNFSQNQLAGRSRWLIPFFISRKLNEDLKEGDSKVSFRIKPEHYSELLTQLIPFCSSSIYMSCPYSPTQWFDKLFEDKPALRSAAKTGGLNEEDFPPHVRQLFLLDHAVEKRRFVIVPDSQIEHLWTETGDLQNFCDYSDSGYEIETRFVAQNKLCNDCDDATHCPDAKGKKPCERDFQIWDGKVSIEYDMASSQCTLSVGPEGKLGKLFDYCWRRQGKGVLDLKTILQRLKEDDSVKKLKDAFQTTQDNQHSSGSKGTA